MAKVEKQCWGLLIDGTADGMKDSTIKGAITKSEENNIDLIIFVNNISNIQQKIPVFFSSEIWKFNGSVLATCDRTTNILDACPVILLKASLYGTIGSVKHVKDIDEFIQEVKGL